MRANTFFEYNVVLAFYIFSHHDERRKAKNKEKKRKAKSCIAERKKSIKTMKTGPRVKVMHASCIIKFLFKHSFDILETQKSHLYSSYVDISRWNMMMTFQLFLRLHTLSLNWNVQEISSCQQICLQTSFFFIIIAEHVSLQMCPHRASWKFAKASATQIEKLFFSFFFLSFSFDWLLFIGFFFLLF